MGPKAVRTPGLRELAGKEDLSQQEMLSWALLVLLSPRQAFPCCIEAMVTSFYVDHSRPFIDSMTAQRTTHPKGL